MFVMKATGSFSGGFMRMGSGDSSEPQTDNDDDQSRAVDDAQGRSNALRTEVIIFSF